MRNLKNVLIFAGGFLLACTIFALHSCSREVTGKTETGTLNIASSIYVGHVPLGKIGAEEFKGISILAEGDTTTVLYRISSGEVLDISEKGNPFSKANAAYFMRSVNPIFLDGEDETISKIILLGGVNPDTVRNATGGEIVTFISLKADDMLEEELDGINRRLENDPQFRKFVKALVKMLVTEFNRSRTLDGVVLLTNTQALNALKNELNKND